MDLTNGGHADPDSEVGVWMSVSDLAKHKGITRQSAAERVSRLEDEGRITTRRQGRSKLVELASYDRAIGETGDVAKEAAAETKKESATASPELRDAQTRKAIYDAQFRALDLAERQKQLLPIDGDHGIELAATQCGLALAREIDGILRHADELTSAANKDGVTGTRRVLKTIANNMREATAKAMHKLASHGEEAERAGSIETNLAEDTA